MAKTNIITGLDIGSSSIKMVVAIPKSEQGSDLKEEPKFEVLFRGEELSLGVRRGVVVDVDKVSRIIRSLAERARAETGHKINSVFVNLSGSHISCVSSRGIVAVSRADRKISKEDVERVLQEAVKTAPLPPNHELLEVFSREFIIDGVEGIKRAEGLQGGRLEAEVLIVSSFLPYKNNLIQTVLDADLQILDITASPIADSFAVLSQKQKELGSAVLNIGAGTSELAVFEEGDLSHLAIFPIGSGNITSDIAVGLKTDIDLAESIKLKMGSCSFKGKDKKEKINGVIEGEEPLVFSRKMLGAIIEARLSDIFEETQKELKKMPKKGLLPGGIVLTGGAATMPKIAEMARKELKLPCSPGKISPFPEIEDELAYSSVCGLICRGADPDSNLGGTSAGFWGRIKSVFKNFLP